jgi:hypothetical protein
MFRYWNNCGLFFWSVCGKSYSYGRRIPAELFWLQQRGSSNLQHGEPLVMRMEARWM